MRLPNYDREEFMRWCVEHARLPSVPVERERWLNTIAVDGSHLPVRVDFIPNGNITLEVDHDLLEFVIVKKSMNGIGIRNH